MVEDPDVNKELGKWLIKGQGITHYYYCSICGNSGDFWDKTCKYCGATMYYGPES